MNTEDTTVDIWERKYMARVPALDGASMSFLKAHGTYVTGNKSIDNANVNNWITTYLTIARMIEYYREGVTVAIVRYEDTKLIYESIERHLNAWLHQLKHGLNIGNAPIDDLIEMDRFASTIYQHARHIIPPESVQDLFRMNLGRIRANPMQLLGKAEDSKPEVIEERNSMAEFFKARIGGIKRF